MSDNNFENFTVNNNNLTREKTKTPIMLDLTVSNEEKVITQIVFKKYVAYFTDLRVIIYNTEKIGGSITVNSIPYNKITSWDLRYKSINDKLPVLWLYFGQEFGYYHFTNETDVLTLHKVLVHYCCK